MLSNFICKLNESLYEWYGKYPTIKDIAKDILGVLLVLMMFAGIYFMCLVLCVIFGY